MSKPGGCWFAIKSHFLLSQGQWVTHCKPGLCQKGYKVKSLKNISSDKALCPHLHQIHKNLNIHPLKYSSCPDSAAIVNKDSGVESEEDSGDSGEKDGD